MKIIIHNIPEEGLHLQFHKDSDWFQNLLPEKERNDFSLQDVTVQCTVKRMCENVFIDGNLDTIVFSKCCRCLEVTQIPVTSVFRYTFVPAKDAGEEVEELASEDLEYGHYRDDVIDLDTVIFEQIMLQIPMKVLCNEACKGLCPHCGINLNTARCDCHADFVDERLAVLKKLKISDKK